jgi:hypothetical protein
MTTVSVYCALLKVGMTRIVPLLTAYAMQALPSKIVQTVNCYL